MAIETNELKTQCNNDMKCNIAYNYNALIINVCHNNILYNFQN